MLRKSPAMKARGLPLTSLYSPKQIPKMKSEHSVPVDPYSYESMGLFDSLAVRNSKHERLAVQASRQAQEDWKRHAGPITGFVGASGKYHFIAATIPECLPERLGALAYASELGFLLDGTVALNHTFSYPLYLRPASRCP